MTIRFKCMDLFGLVAMSMSVNINPSTNTVEGTRSLRNSGSSVVLTIPPEVLQSLDLGPGDEMKITGDWSTRELTVRPTE